MRRRGLTFTPLHFTFRRFRLLSYVQRGKTALYQAALGGQRATMEKLIEFGANIEARNPVSGLVWWWS